MPTPTLDEIHSQLGALPAEDAAGLVRLVIALVDRVQDLEHALRNCERATKYAHELIARGDRRP